MKLQEATDIKLGSTSASKVMLGYTQVWPKINNNHLLYGEVVDPSQPLPTIQLYNDNSNVKTYTPTLDTVNNTFYINDWGTVPTFNTLADNFLTNKSNIKTITMLKGLDTSNVTNMALMFAECSSLTSLDVSNLNTSNVIYMGSMFGGCSSLTSLDISNFNTSNVTDMQAMFGDCSSITSLDVSNLDTSKVIYIGSMFDGYSLLTSLNLSNFNTSNVTDMQLMFNNCSSLTSLDLSNLNTSNVTTTEYMFSGCSSLTSLNLSNWNTSKVYDMRYMFQGCSSLYKLDLSNWDVSNVTNMSYMFKNCSVLTELDLSNWNITKISAGSNKTEQMFYFCTNLSDVYINKQNTLNTLTNGLTMAGDPSNDYLYLSDTAIIHYTDEADPSTVIDYYWDGSAWTTL